MRNSDFSTAVPEAAPAETNGTPPGGEMKGLKFSIAAVALGIALCMMPATASAGAIGYVGSAGFGFAGTVVDASCFTCFFSVSSAFDTGVLPDGLRVTGIANETIQQVGG